MHLPLKCQPQKNSKCQYCDEYFTPKGLPTHIGVKHKHGRLPQREPSVRINTGREDVPGPSTRHTQPSQPRYTQGTTGPQEPIPGDREDIGSLLQKCKREIKICSIIPAVMRPQITHLLTEVIEKVTSNNDEPSWLALLSFAWVVLQLPSHKQDDISLATIIRQNIRAFQEGSLLEYRRQDQKFSSSKKKNRARDVIKVAEQKLSEGDITSAARLLTSSDQYANEDQAFGEMLTLHPQAPTDYITPEPPNELTRPPITSKEEINRAVLSFPKSSSGGMDAIRPRHLRDLIGNGVASERLVIAIGRLIDLLMTEELPSSIRQILFGAKLIALRKASGKFRPIACSSVYKRILSKIIVWRVTPMITETVGEHQVGCGTPGGTEAAIHATSAFLSEGQGELKIMVKLDFANAFNTVRRDRMLRMVKNVIPMYYAPIYQMYAHKSQLFMSDNFIWSSSGIQQGDPLGPALFCLAIAEVVKSLSSTLNIWYLDDGTLGGNVQHIMSDISKIQNSSIELGLELNTQKCEMYVHNGSESEVTEIVGRIQSILPGCKLLESNEVVLLGAPLLKESSMKAMSVCVEKTKLMFSRLRQMGAHRALFLLKSSLGASRLTHILRSGSISEDNIWLADYDNLLIEELRSILNIDLTDRMWKQASLPVAHGGLGILSPKQILLPSQLSSRHATEQVVKQLVQEETWNAFRNKTTELEQSFLIGDRQRPECHTSQKEWTKVVFNEVSQHLLNEARDNVTKARLLATTTAGAGAWLNAVPSVTTGTWLDDDSTRICVGLRLGATLVAEHKCVCGSDVSSSGTHGLSCRRSAGRFVRHATLNEILSRTLKKANMPNILEPPGLVRDDGKKPDGLTLVPYKQGKPLVWDATVADTLANSYVDHCAYTRGYAAELAETNKLAKYGALREDYVFTPFAFETLGGPGPKTSVFMKEICKKLHTVTGTTMPGVYFRQQVSLCIQRGNAASVLGTMHQRMGGIYHQHYTLN